MSKENRFKVGRAYQHHSGEQMFMTGIVDTIMYGVTMIAECGHNRELLQKKQREYDEYKPTDGEVIGPRPGSGGWGEQFRPVSMVEGSMDNWFEIPVSEWLRNNTSN